MKEFVVPIKGALSTAGNEIKRTVFSWRLPVALIAAISAAACSPAVETQQSIQSVNVVYPSLSKENLGLTPGELNLLQSIKRDFMEQATAGNIFGFALDKSSKNEKQTPQEIIAKNLSKAATEAAGSPVTYTSDQIDAPNDEVMPMQISIGEKNLPMIFQPYDVQIEGEEKPTKLVFIYTKEDGIWRQTGFITKQPTIANGVINYEFESMSVVPDDGSFTAFGMVIASDAGREKNNMIAFTNIDGRLALEETFANGFKVTGFLPSDSDFFFPTNVPSATSSDRPISFKINSAVTEVPPIEATPLPPPTPLPPSVNAEYSPLQTMLDGQKVPYEIVGGQIEVGGRKIIANDLGLIIFADQTGIQTWNQETNSWRVLNFSDESTFTGILKENWDKLGVDIKDGTSYATTPEYQKKLDQEIKFIRRHFILNQTEWLANNADVVKSWGKESASELSDQQIQWLYFKYNIENKQISLLSPSEARMGVNKEDAPLAFTDKGGNFHRGIFALWGTNESNLAQNLAILNDIQNYPPVDINIFGVKTKVTRPLENSSTGNLIAIAIIPGIPSDQGVLEIVHFNPSPLNNNKHGLEIRAINLVDLNSNSTIRNNRLAIVPSSFIIRSSRNQDLNKPLLLSDLIDGLGNVTSISAISSDGKFIDYSGTESKIYQNFPFSLGIFGGQKISITDFTDQVWPWDLSQ